MTVKANMIVIGVWELAWVEAVGVASEEPSGGSTAWVEPVGEESVESSGGSTGRTGTGLSLHPSPVQHSMLQSSKVQFCGWALNQAVTSWQAVVLSVTMKQPKKTITRRDVYSNLLYTTQVNSTFRARWLASSEVISQVLHIHLRAAEEKQNGCCRYIFTNKVYSLGR